MLEMGNVNGDVVTSLTEPKWSMLGCSTPIDLEATLFSGQAFRWYRSQAIDGGYFGILDHAPILVKQFSPTQLGFFTPARTLYQQVTAAYLQRYFGVDDTIDEMIPQRFRERYSHLMPVIEAYSGIRILRQPLFETLISFMCAQGVGIMLIRRQVARLASLSEETLSFGHDESSVFPTAECLANTPLHTLTQCTNNNRIRAKHIHAVATAVAESRLNLTALESLSQNGTVSKDAYVVARETLMTYGGIGEKIADCVCLFGLGALSSFPIDTHVRQFMEAWFGVKRSSAGLSAKQYARIQRKAWKEMGPYAGYLSQILFHYWRRHVRKLGVE